MEENKTAVAAAENTPAENEESVSVFTEKKPEKKGKWGRRIFGTLGILLLVLVVAAAVLLYGPVKTISTIERIDDGIYKITYSQDYKLDKALKANIRTEDEFLKFVSDNFYFGIPVKANQDYVACSTFLTENPGGGYIAGRNFDYSETDLLTVYTKPDKGYASIGMVPLGSVNIGIKDGIQAESTMGKFLMLAAPYLCVDGMNEKGLMVAVLDLNPPSIRQDTGKPKINTMIAVRMLLDRAANVEEAIHMLEQYDFNSMSRMAQHIYLADAQGGSAVVEWRFTNEWGQKNGFERKITRSPVCTNFWLCDGETEGKCNRFDTLTKRLTEKPVNTPEDAMQNLDAASVSWTQWSCVYQLSDFSVNIVLDNNHSKVFSISPDDFRK
ncbi:MAG: linear amide C-N hydrolase [Clostridia bacterium]|nr:linear amide C-N hydrolase [Clostridia bacterium]